MESWKVNLISVWFGCFFTGLAISQILPFLPLYVSQLGVTSHEALSMWSGLTFSVTFSGVGDCLADVGSLADRKGRKLMLLRASLGMAIAILLQAFATNVWQLFILRAVMGLTSGYIPNAMALVASQVPRERSGWALSTLSTAQISGVIGGPLLGGFLADHVGLRAVFFITAILLTVSFLVTLFLIKEGVRPQTRAERLSGKAVFASLPYPGLVISLFFTTLVIQLCNGSIGPILALFIKSMAPDSNNIAFLAGMIAAVPGVSALISAPRLGKPGDRIGTSRILLATLCCAVVMFFAMSFVTTPFQLGVLRFLLGFADGAMLPAVQRFCSNTAATASPGVFSAITSRLCILATWPGADWRVGLGHGRLPLGVYRHGGYCPDQYLAAGHHAAPQPPSCGLIPLSSPRPRWMRQRQ
ncbi:MAG: multidrug efflux MFS transporter [Enterobacteriaceae bacterium]